MIVKTLSFAALLSIQFYRIIVYVCTYVHTHKTIKNLYMRSLLPPISYHLRFSLSEIEEMLHFHHSKTKYFY